MKRTVAEIQNCKDGLCLPDKAENTLLVFKRAEQLQKQLLELEQVENTYTNTYTQTNTTRTVLSIVFISSQLALEYSIEVQDISAPSLSAPPLSVPPLGVPPTITEEETQVRQNITLKCNDPNAKIMYYNMSYFVCVGERSDSDCACRGGCVEKIRSNANDGGAIHARAKTHLDL